MFPGAGEISCPSKTIPTLGGVISPNQERLCSRVRRSREKNWPTRRETESDIPKKGGAEQNRFAANGEPRKKAGAMRTNTENSFLI